MLSLRRHLPWYYCVFTVSFLCQTVAIILPNSASVYLPCLNATTTTYSVTWVCVYLYLYSAQYIHVLQDSKRYMTHLTVQVQSICQVTGTPLTERQMLKDDHSSTSLRFFKLPLGIRPNHRGTPFKVAIRATMYLPMSSVFLGECVTH